MTKEKIIIGDAVDFTTEFENWLEKEYPTMTFEQRAQASGKLLEFLETKKPQ